MSDESLRKAGRAELDRLNKPKPADKPAAVKPKPKKRGALDSLRDMLDPSKKRDTAHNGETVDEVVDRAVKGAKPDPY